jgi:polyribonucleotide nucleotidyltransferase
MSLNGKELSLETGRLAKQASGAVLASFGDTKVLVTVCIAPNERELDYFPLRVDYEERFYASGKIPGGFFKREGRPSDTAVLSARLIDRPIRPLFPKGYDDEVQIVATVLSAEPDCPPAVPAILGASSALMLSKAPFQQPIAAVKVGRADGRLVLNPDAEAADAGGVDITVAGTEATVTMVEGMMDELPEDEVIAAIDDAHRAIQQLVELQRTFIAKAMVEPTTFVAPEEDEHPEREAQLRAMVWPEFPALYEIREKKERSEYLDELRERSIAALIPEGTEEEDEAALRSTLGKLFDAQYEQFMREGILERGIRIDGRRPDELRPITCEVGVLPRAHGSALFVRGETQSLGIATLGATRSDEQIIDQMMKEGRKRFMLHYNFPPFSVGEVRRIGSPSRRSIGHGYLAENSLRSVLPGEEEFPYVIRLVSEILESNGSSSMASVCSGSLAMMDAGVPIDKPVAGIAMGLIQDPQTGKRVVLTDIQGAEDHHGDMDFKVVGTRDGVTGFQLDVKVGGVTRETLQEALTQAKAARLAILDAMTQSIAAPRSELSPYAPKLETLSIPVEKIGLVIGPGGRTIRAIIEETGAEIDIEDDGTVRIAGPNGEAAAAARRWIEDMTAELEVGTVLKTKVTRIVDFGAFVELPNGTEGLVHVSNLADGFVDNVRDIVSPGDEMTIEVIGEDKMGRPDLKRIDGGAEGGASASPRRPPTGDKRRRDRGGDRERGKPAAPPATPEREVHEGDIIDGVVTNTTDYGAFVELTPSITGLVHISELSDDYVRRVEDVLRQGDKVTVEVLRIDDRGRYKLRRVAPEGTTPEPEADEPAPPAAAPTAPPEPEEESFEDRW